MPDEIFAAMLGAGASHVGGKAAERFVKRYGLVLTGAGLVGLWWLHRQAKAPKAGPPAGELGL